MLIAVFLACASAARADILMNTWWCDNDHDKAISCVQTDFQHDSGAGTYNLTIAGDQFWGPGHMLMDFQTNSTTDPKITSINEIGNDTGFAWTGYVVNVTLDAADPLTSYSISNVSVTTPGDWSWTPTGTQSLAYVGINGSGQYEYDGTITLQGGTAIGNGDELDFSYKLTFAGSTVYHAVQEMSPVPEPSTIVLLGSGLLGLCLLRRRTLRR